jgi:N-acetylglutamate synthase-like GNAT family acetyltransferase
LADSIKISLASKEDSSKIYSLQLLSFQKEAADFQDYRMPALKDSSEKFAKSFDRFTYLKAEAGGEIIGTIRAEVTKKICKIGRFAIHPDYQNQGIGTRLISVLEKHFNLVEKYELFTGILSRRNMHFYKKLGYIISHEEEIAQRKVLFLIKNNKN